MADSNVADRSVSDAAEPTGRAVWLIVLCSLLVTSSLWWQSVNGHSYPLNISWHEGFVAELRAGALYPRWLNATNQGLGAPSFYFYAPLPFFVSALCDILSPIRFSTAAFVYTSATIAVVCSGLSLFAFARRIVTVHAAALAAVVYLAMPYHLGIDLWWRAALGELWAFVWPPLILAGAMRQWRGERWGRALFAAASAGLIVSHLPSFLIVTCGATCAAVLWWTITAQRPKASKLLIESTLSMCVAVPLTAAYWLPALTTLGYTDVTRFMTSGWFQYSNNFVLPYRPDSWNGTIETLLLAELIAVCVLVWRALRLNLHRTPVFRICVACIGAAIFMMTPASKLIWQLIPPLQRVQFPWRFHILVDLAVVTLLALVADTVPAQRARRLWTLAAPIICLAAGLAWPVLFAPRYAENIALDLRATLTSRADANEYRTHWTPEPFFFGIRNGDTLVSRRADAHAVSPDAHRRIELSGTASAPIELVLNRFWYPSLRVSDDANGRTIAAHPQTATGLAIVSVQAGVQTLRVETVLLAEERAGWALSSATALCVLLSWWRSRRASAE
jgi:hypothetical protein